MGGYHDTCGDIMSTVGVFSTVEYSNNKRHGMFSTVGDIMMHMGDIMSTGPWGCSLLWGIPSFEI